MTDKAEVAARAFCAGYFNGTVGSIRSRYAEKFEMCLGADPYELCEGEDTSTSVEPFPNTTYEDIMNYLVLSTSLMTLMEMNAHKSMEGHNYFTSGWLNGVSVKKLGQNKVLVLSKVNHSQRLKDAPLKVWILSHTSGEILTAHCACMAGAGEVCSHIAAVLFAVEAHVRVRSAVSCTGKENSWLPPSTKNVEFKKMSDIDFCSSKTKKRKLDGILQEQNQTTPNSSFEKQIAGRPAVPSATPSELDSFYKELQSANATPAIFSVLPGYSDVFSTVQMREPTILTTL